LSDAHIGCVITVEATVSLGGWFEMVDDSTTVPVAPLDSPVVTLDNYAPQVGETLTATVTDYPMGALVSYEWFCGATTLAGPTVAAATYSATYQVQVADIGCVITVEATVALGGWLETVDDSTTAAAKPPTVSVSITGGAAPKVGTALTAVAAGLPAGWTCPSTNCVFTWHRGVTPGIQVNTGATYMPGGMDVGYKLMVQMVVTWPNGSQSTVTATTAKIVVPTAAPKTTITGKNEVGQTLTAKMTDPTGTGQRYGCDWFRQGTTARIGTGLTYTVKAADAGKKITVTCTLLARGAYTFKPASASVKIPPAKKAAVVEHMVQVVESPSLVGRPYGDILAVDKRGVLWRYPGSASGKLGARSMIGKGWLGYTLYPPGDWNLDGKNDLVAVKGGQMYLYRGDGKGHLAKPIKIGHGWSPYTVIPAGDLTGDGYPDMLAIHKKTGLLLLYKGDGKGGFQSGFTQVGHRWVGKQLFSAGDLTKNGTRDILGVTRDGRLLFFDGRGTGFFKPAIQVGWNWNGLRLVAGADINGDGIADICSITPNGDINLYKGRGVGTFYKPYKIGSGF